MNLLYEHEGWQPPFWELPLRSTTSAAVSASTVFVKACKSRSSQFQQRKQEAEHTEGTSISSSCASMATDKSPRECGLWRRGLLRGLLPGGVAAGDGLASTLLTIVAAQTDIRRQLQRADCVDLSQDSTNLKLRSESETASRVLKCAQVRDLVSIYRQKRESLSVQLSLRSSQYRFKPVFNRCYNGC